MIKTLAKSVREYKKLALLAPCAVTLEVVMEVLIPLLMANLIDNGIYGGSMTAIYKTGLMLVIAAFLSLAFGAIAGIFASKATSGFAKNLRHDLYSAVQKYSFSNIDKFSTASIITRLTTDVTYVKQSFQMIIRIAVRAPLMLAFSLIMAIRINAKLSLIFLCLIPFIATGLILIFRKVHPIFESVFKRYDDLNNVVEENVSGIRVVKSFVLEDEETEKFTGVSNEIYQNFTRAERIMALSSPLMQFGIYVAIILISWFGAKIIINSGMTELTTGELTSLITYAVQVLASLMMLSMIFVMITISKASAERITEILKEVPTIENPDKPVMNVKNGDIEFIDLSFSYVGKKEKECLKDINLKIKSGETIGIIGGTGSGKSTLVNLIPRLYDTTEGMVKVSDLDVRKYDLNVLRDAVSMVLQKNVLFSGTIKENLRWGNKEATDEDLKRVCKLARIDDFIDELPNKYDTVIEQGGTNFSGGQKQRLCIARALLKNPKILILDDSTSAVDTKTDSLIRKSFREEIPDVTKIIVAQRIASVQDADKIIVMEDGKINGFGTHEELLKTNEIYREVYESQNSVGGQS